MSKATTGQVTIWVSVLRDKSQPEKEHTWARGQLRSAGYDDDGAQLPKEAGIIDLGKVNLNLGVDTKAEFAELHFSEEEKITIQVGRDEHPILRKDDWFQAQAFFRFNIKPIHPTLTYLQKEFFEWSQCAYRPMEPGEIESLTRDFLQRAYVAKQKQDGTFTHEPFMPDSKDRSELINALAENCFAKSERPAPFWRDERYWIYPDRANLPEPSECIAFQNAILHAPSGKLLEPTPFFFTHNALDFDYVAEACAPFWEKVLDDYWPRKPDGSPADEVLLLQEIFGYLLLPWTSLQKLFVFVGSGRNGKGVIMKILTLLLGARNVGHPTMSSLANPNFGKEPLIGKLLALISEMGFGRNDDKVGATNFLKAVSGEDGVEIPRKFRGAWSGTLPVRFVMSGNKVPSFVDDSPALGERLISLKFSRTFSESERDYNLSDKLALELPGILNWALVGYKRLRESKRFTLPKASEELTADIKRAASGVESFIDEACDLDPADMPNAERHHVTEDALYGAYKAWCDRLNSHSMKKLEFVEAMAAAKPLNIQKWRPDIDGDRTKRGPRSFRGLALVADHIPF